MKRLAMFCLLASSFAYAYAQIKSVPLDTNFTQNELKVSPNFTSQILFQKEEKVVKLDGKTAPAKGKFDFMAYWQKDSTTATLWVNHETGLADKILGDGGGATLLDLEYRENKWYVTQTPRAVDFSSLGGTYYNCLGAATPWGTVLTSEENPPVNNAEFIKNGWQDTSDYDLKPLWKNFGWMVEVDIKTGKAIQKVWGMGRYSHEGAFCLPDSQTVFLADDYAPGMFFKFVAEKKGDLSKGTLFAYKQSLDGKKGEWIALGNDENTLLNARDSALSKGCTFFIRLEDIEQMKDGRFLITETGIDEVDMTDAVKLGGKPAMHLKPYTAANNMYRDFYGRILVYDPKTEQISVFLQGGMAAKKHDIVLGNPDNMAIDFKRNVLVIHEDCNGTSRDRVPDYARHGANNSEDYTNEVFLLDLQLKTPTLDSLKRIIIAPKGSETTGGVFSTDFQHYFFNIQHPSSKNPFPYNKDATVVITGFDRILPKEEPKKEEKKEEPKK